MLRLVNCGLRRYLSFEELEELPFVFHLFTIKQSGPALLTAVRKFPRETLLSCLGRTETVVPLKQLHGNSVVWLGKENRHEKLEGDGLLTLLPGVMLAIQTADCLPILVVDTKRKVVGNLHAGWRGTLRNVTGTAIREMLESGSQVRDLIVAFGPGIGVCCYEVGMEVVTAFREEFPESDSFFVSRPGYERKFLDLRKANHNQAIQLGLKPDQIFWNSYCTQCDRDMFFSYRREGARTGRMFALIGIQ
ncbi:MAG: peptidoglycan editing factor PgeF [Acidobacteria bacterium]|nr:peptidoglycan editing factor PgeF [Acidobacteriota bacterium]